MAELFEITDLVKLAIEDERSGVAFYAALAEKFAHEPVAPVFADLGEQEKFHQKRFEEMLEALGGHRAKREQYPGEFMAYLETLASGRAFPNEETAVKEARDCASAAAAVDLAARFERDTLLLMNEMSRLVPDKHADVVRELAQEEQSHLVTLANARRKL